MLRLKAHVHHILRLETQRNCNIRNEDISVEHHITKKYTYTYSRGGGGGGGGGGGM